MNPSWLYYQSKLHFDLQSTSGFATTHVVVFVRHPITYQPPKYVKHSPWRKSGNTQTHIANFSGTYHTLIERKSYILENKWTFLFAGTPLLFCFFSNGMANSEHTKEYPTNNIFPRFPKKYDLRYIILFNPLLPV